MQSNFYPTEVLLTIARVSGSRDGIKPIKVKMRNCCSRFSLHGPTSWDNFGYRKHLQIYLPSALFLWNPIPPSLRGALMLQAITPPARNINWLGEPSRPL